MGPVSPRDTAPLPIAGTVTSMASMAKRSSDYGSYGSAIRGIVTDVRSVT